MGACPVAPTEGQLNDLVFLWTMGMNVQILEGQSNEKSLLVRGATGTVLCSACRMIPPLTGTLEEFCGM